MKKYILLQEEIEEQIEIVDNSSVCGKMRVEELCTEGFEPIGYLESEQPPARLLRGFNKNANDKADKKDLKLWNIRKILDE